MKEHRKNFRSWTSFFVVLVLIFSYFPSLAETDYQQEYDFAINLLCDLSNMDHLSQAVNIFEELGTYKNSKLYARYIYAILSLYNDDLQTANGFLEFLSGVPEFSEDLISRSLPSCDKLIKYISARSMESAGNYADAIQMYKDCNILDSIDRAFSLSGASLPTPELQQSNTVIQKVEEENSYFSQELTLSAKNSSGGISLKWNKLPDAVQYHIFWRIADETDSPYNEVKTKVKTNSFLHAARLRSGTVYTYYVTAVDKEGHTLDSNHIDIKRIYIKPSEPQSSTSDTSSGSSSSSSDSSSSSSSQSTPNPQFSEIVLPPFDD